MTKILYSNINICDIDKFESYETNLLIEDGVVSDIGRSINYDKYTEVIDLRNFYMLPGLVDSHGHMTHLGKNQYEVDLRDCKSEYEVVNKIKNFLDLNNNLLWINGGGWNQENFDTKLLPDNKYLSINFPNIPVTLSRIDGHAIWCNKKALDMANIHEDTPVPDGGEILKKDGLLTGILVDKAQQLIRNIIPSESIEDVKKWILKAQEVCLSNGLTEVHDAGISSIQFDAYKELINDGKLKIRVYAMANQELFENNVSKYKSELFELRSVKLVADGALGSNGAALIDQYQNLDTYGILILDKNKLKTLFSQAFKEDFQVCIHAIGDKTNREIVRALREVLGNSDQDQFDHRTRIEHAQIIKEEDIKEISDLNIIASVQPMHCISDMDMAEERLGERIKDSYLWKTLIDNNILLIGGSDFPVEDSSPLMGIYAAVNRTKFNNIPYGGWQPKELLNLKEALEMYTKNTAYGSFKENLKGNIEIGHIADFTFIDRDISSLPNSDILKCKISATMVNGEMVYKDF